MPVIWRKGTFGTGGPSRAHTMSATPRPEPIVVPPAATNGKLYTWGRTTSGQLGLGAVSGIKYTPLQVGALTTWKKISLGSSSAAAIKSDGTLWTWGLGTGGVSGLGNVTSYNSPKQVGALTTWDSVSTAQADTSPGRHAIQTNGTLWAWGGNAIGQLGLSNKISYSSPKQVGALTNWSKVSFGTKWFVGAIKTNGTLWSWGSNTDGQLGDGTYTSKSSPVQVGALTDWSVVAAGNKHMSAVKTDGTLWSWGYNSSGQLGLGNTTSYSSPMQIGSSTDWLSVSIGYDHTFAIKTNGTLWAWGDNTNGCLGLGDGTSRNSPTQVGALTTWQQVATGNQHAIALKTDGTLWSWGINTQGQTGLGSSYYSTSSPMQIGSLTTWIKIPEQSMGSFSSAAIST